MLIYSPSAFQNPLSLPIFLMVVMILMYFSKYIRITTTMRFKRLRKMKNGHDHHNRLKKGYKLTLLILDLGTYQRQFFRFTSCSPHTSVDLRKTFEAMLDFKLWCKLRGFFKPSKERNVMTYHACIIATWMIFVDTTCQYKRENMQNYVW